MLELLGTLKVQSSEKGEGHFRIYGTLTIGHALLPGVQRVQCWPFKDMHYHGSNRQDFVFIRPPGIEEGGFTLRPDNVWYCKVLLLFSIQTQTDQDGSTEEFQCAFVSVLEPLEERSPDPFQELRKRGSLVLYELDPKVPRVYVVPIQSILGKLPLVPVGDTGTIPFEPSARTRAEREALAEEFYPGAFCDSAKGSGNGCRLWHVNSFALGWSRDD